jgi:hypothetical protein
MDESGSVLGGQGVPTSSATQATESGGQGEALSPHRVSSRGSTIGSGGGTIGAAGGGVGQDIRSMSLSQVSAEIEAMKNDPRGLFGDRDEDTQWVHQRKVDRWTALQQRFGELDPARIALLKSHDPGMMMTLRDSGVTKEFLEKKIGEREARDAGDVIRRTEEKLRRELGGEKNANAVIDDARSVFNEVANKEDYAWADSTGAGNDPDLLQSLARLKGNAEAIGAVKKIGLRAAVALGRVILDKGEKKKGKR